jgi:hypothetical protein
VTFSGLIDPCLTLRVLGTSCEWAMVALCRDWSGGISQSRVRDVRDVHPMRRSRCMFKNRGSVVGVLPAAKSRNLCIKSRETR